MAGIIVLFTAIILSGLAYYLYQVGKKRLEGRIRTNENRAAVTIRDYARSVKMTLDEAKRKGNDNTINSRRISVPSVNGYKLTLELSVHSFQIHGVPRLHNKTGRLSFFTDHSLIVKAADRSGDTACAKDEAFQRLTSEIQS